MPVEATVMEHEASLLLTANIVVSRTEQGASGGAMGSMSSTDDCKWSIAINLWQCSYDWAVPSDTRNVMRPNTTYA